MIGWDLYSNLKTSGDIIYTVILGFVLISVTFIVYFIRNKKELVDLKTFFVSVHTNRLTISGFIVFFGIIIVLYGSNSIFTNNSISKKISYILDDNTIEELTFISGVVEVISQDYAGIKLDKEIIKINNKIFRIPAGLRTLFYNTTIEQGGILSKGKNVTIFYIEIDKNNENDSYFFEEGKICRIIVN